MTWAVIPGYKNEKLSFIRGGSRGLFRMNYGF
jgi:hypothetical protein